MSLAAQNISYAHRIADKIHRRYFWMDRDDFRAEAAYGLVIAERSYDPSRGVLFTSYAHPWVTNYVLRYIAGNSRSVRAGSPALFWTLRRVRQGRSKAEDEQILARKPDEEVAALLMYNEGRDKSFSDPIGDEENSFTLLDTLSNPEDTERVHKIDGEDFVADVVAGLGELRPLYMAILHEMILAEDPVTLQELGDRFGVSRERVRQLRVKLVKKITDYVQEEECPTRSSASKSPKMT